MLEDVVVVLALVEGECVLEAGAAAAANGYAKNLIGLILCGEQVLELAGGDVGDLDGCIGRVHGFRLYSRSGHRQPAAVGCSSRSP